MSKRDINRRETGLGIVSAATKVMAVGAVGLTGAVALLADHIYNVQHSAATAQGTATHSVSSTSSNSSSEGSDDGSLQSTAAPSASSSTSASSSGGSSSVVSGGS
jgi:hypothetical protein